MSSSLYVALYGCVAALAVLVLVLGARRPDRRAATLAGAASVALGVALGVAGPRIPDDWITVLQEGLTRLHVRELRGQGAHIGEGLRAFLDLLVPGVEGDGLRTLVRWNAALSITNAGLFAILAVRIVGRIAGIALTLVFALHPLARDVALSELPCEWLTLIFFIGVAVTNFALDPASSARARWLGWSALAGLVTVAATIRVESLVIGAPTLLTSGYVLRVGRDVCDARWRDLGARFVRWAPRHPLAWLAALAVIALGHALFGAPSVGAVELGPDLVPIGAFALPATLTLTLPIGMVVLFVLGAIHALRTPSAFLHLPLSVLALQQVYLAAGHGGRAPYETYRYLGGIVPMVFFLALFGWRELRTWLERLEVSAERTRFVAAAVVFSFAWWNMPGLTLLHDSMEYDRYPRGHALDPGRDLFLRRDQQIEERYLLALVERYPECEFVARVLPWENVGDRGFNDAPISNWSALWFGRSSSPNDDVAAPPWHGDARDMAADHDASCVLYYRSLDCNLANAGAACDGDVAGLRLLEERRTGDVRYYFHVRMQPELRLGVYRVR